MTRIRVGLALVSIAILVALWWRKSLETPKPTEPPTMSAFSATALPALVRTDFSDDAAWQAVLEGIRQVPSEMRAAMDMMMAMNEGRDAGASGEAVVMVNIVDDSQYKDLSPGEVLARLHPNPYLACLFVADGQTMEHPDHPVLVISLSDDRHRPFRTIPTQVFAIASNLPIANMDWEDFANRVDDAGVFRGFPNQ